MPHGREKRASRDITRAEWLKITTAGIIGGIMSTFITMSVKTPEIANTGTEKIKI